MMKILMMACLLIACLVNGAGHALAAAAGHFTLLGGRVDVLHKDADKVVPAALGDAVFVGDIVRTKSNSKAQITLADESILTLAAGSRMEIRRFSFSSGSNKRREGMFHMFRGQLRSVVHHEEGDTAFNFKVETPTAVAAVRGTDWYSIVSSDALSTFICKTGKVEIMSIDPNVKGIVVIGANQFTRVARKQTPQPAKTVEPDVLGNIVDTSANQPPSADETEALGQATQDSGPSGQTAGGGAQDDGSSGSSSSGSGQGSNTAKQVNSSVTTNATTIGQAIGAAQPATGTTSATPPITTTAPAVLTSPVTIQVVF